MAVGDRLATLRFVRSSGETRAPRANIFVQAGWCLWASPKAAKATFVALHSAEKMT